MGIVCVPFKTEYNKDNIIWTYHPIMHEMGMRWDQFKFLWRIFHISSVDLSDVENEENDFYVERNEEWEDNAL